jgi:hypothetical protein
MSQQYNKEIKRKRRLRRLRRLKDRKKQAAPKPVA